MDYEVLTKIYDKSIVSPNGPPHLKMRAEIDSFYQKIIFPHLICGKAQDDREIAHERPQRFFKVAARLPFPVKRAVRNYFFDHDPVLEQEIFGLRFVNPVGLAAGLCKNGDSASVLGLIGVSHVDIGTVTLLPQPGDPRPRLHYLEEDDSFKNHMAFPSDGKDAITQNLGRQRIFYDLILGGNFGPNTSSVEEGSILSDYYQLSRSLAPLVDYITVNLSCHNIPGLVDYQTEEHIKKIGDTVQYAIYELQDQWEEQYGISRKIPVIFKLSPEVLLSSSLRELNPIIKTCMEVADGIMLCNSAVHPSIQNLLHPQHRDIKGAISGKILEEVYLDISHFVHITTEGKIPIIGVGGIYDARTAWNRMTYGGASLIQILSALISEKTSRPNLIYDINKGLAQRVKNCNLRNISQAVGRYDLAEI